MSDALTWPPGWFPDPTGRHDHRWWDGGAWTAHVADAGVATVDPLPEARGAPAAAPARAADVPSSHPSSHPGTDPVAVVALIAGIIGGLLVFAPVIGLAAPVAALVLGLVARTRVRTSGRSGRGIATTGIVLGAVGIVLSLIVTVTSVALLSDPDSEVATLFRDYLTCVETRSIDDCQRELEEQLPGALRRTFG